MKRDYRVVWLWNTGKSNNPREFDAEGTAAINALAVDGYRIVHTATIGTAVLVFMELGDE